jgi:GAF domain-containing protein/class 3 adenylate cyclase
MIFKKWLENLSPGRMDLDARLRVSVWLFFLLPGIGFLVFGIRYGILKDQSVSIFFAGILSFIIIGLFMLRKFYNDGIASLRNTLINTDNECSYNHFQTNRDELHTITHCLKSIQDKYKDVIRQLTRKTVELSILKEFSDGCHLTFDPEEILQLALERSLELTHSDLGSVLLLEYPERTSFVVKANIGGGETIKIGDTVDFETSIAKYAVINKSPLVVEDIEKDSRFGRSNRPQYGTRSFVCMPIKTRKDVAGVLTISRKNEKMPYQSEDVEALTTLLANMASTYDNLLLLDENTRKTDYLNAMGNVFKVLNYNYRDSELLHAIFNEIKEVIPFDLALVLIKDENRPKFLSILDLLEIEPSNMTERDFSEFQGSVIDKALKQNTTLIIDDTSTLSHDIEKELITNKGCGSCLLTPLNMNGVMVGTLVLSAPIPGIFSKSQSLIALVANVLSLAIERNKLSASVSKRNQELETIKQIGSTLASSTFDIKQVLNYTMDMIRMVMDVEAGTLYLVKDEHLEFAAAFNKKAASQKKLRLKLGQGIPGYVATRGESVIINDAGTSPHFFPDEDNPPGFETKSALCVPMISQGKVVGVIEVLNKINSDFIVSDKDLLQSIGSSMSIAIDNANLYKETVSMAEQERGIRSMFQKFVPKEVLEEIIHGNEIGKELVEELKILTFLNLDIRDFSALSRRLGPQKSVFLLNQFFSTMGGIIFKQNGIVDKYLGDGFLAIFGAPVSTTRDADNAVTAALKMQESISSLNDFFVSELGASVNIGISVHTGEAVVGNIGFEMKMDYTVIGDSVNDVFRLQELTKPILNGIVISENTSRACRSRLEVIELESSTYSETYLSDLKLYELLSINDDCKYAA